MMGSTRTRYPFLAALLALIATPVAAMLYLGSGKRAIAYAVLVIACPIVSYQVALAGLWPSGVSWGWLYGVVAVIGAVHAYIMASRFDGSFRGAWYSTWQGMIGIAVAYGLASLGVRASLYEPFRVPASSMLPTLEIGDHFFADKLAYGFKLPFTSIELTRGEMPARGDVVVFKVRSQNVHYVKRIVGLPGDTVAVDPATNELRINGDQVPHQIVQTADASLDVERTRETLGGRAYDLLLTRTARSPGGEYVVPAGHYFVLGDNRDNSRDSRFTIPGMVAEEDIVGRAERVWWNTSHPERAGSPL